jgi:uncharacterized protein YbgA (DUF1722 family)/uncharacterized protein YbbK (DUF523 family)
VSAADTPTPSPLRIGISSCLLGEAVRFDGGHKRDAFLVDTFGRHVEWVPVCPELEVGMGTPRESVRLVRSDSGISNVAPLRMVGVRSGTDWTDRMTAYAGRRAATLARLDLCGYVFKKDSPSCGAFRVKVYGDSGMATRSGTGLFAAEIRRRLPLLPVEEEGRLTDPRLRENFVERVFAYARLRDLFRDRWTVGRLVQFHTAHKLTLMAHSPQAYASLGRLVANARSLDRRTLRQDYETMFMQALERVATPKRHANVLQHVAGYLSKGLDSGSRRELQDLIAEHRTGLVPLIVPLTLVRHHVRRLGVSYLAGQTYLDPHPRELALRNHV